MSERQVRLLISGRVQGVDFRDFVWREAEARKLMGWVRNRRDGAVEALAAGPSESVDEFIAACWRGPPASRVSGIIVEAAENDEPLAAFSVRPTA
jgi:acylphosphatase